MVWSNTSTQVFEVLSGYSLQEVKGKKPSFLLQREQTDKETIKRISKNLKRVSLFMKKY